MGIMGVCACVRVCVCACVRVLAYPRRTLGSRSVSSRMHCNQGSTRPHSLPSRRPGSTGTQRTSSAATAGWSLAYSACVLISVVSGSPNSCRHLLAAWVTPNQSTDCNEYSAVCFVRDPKRETDTGAPDGASVASCDRVMR